MIFTDQPWISSAHATASIRATARRKWTLGVLFCSAVMVASAQTAPGLWTPLADPHADNPFPVPHVQTPKEASVRWAGFESRIGTNRTNDFYHWWRHDVTNRAEMQDIWFQEEMVAADTPMDWNGDYDTWNPGRTSQAWRNAVLRVLNLQRYNYVHQVPGQVMNFLRENVALVPTVQATALVIANGGPKSYYHNLRWNYPERRPAGCPDDLWNLAVWGAGNSNLAPQSYTAYGVVATYVLDSGNPDSGHRIGLFTPLSQFAAVGETGKNWAPDEFYFVRYAQGKYEGRNVFNIDNNTAAEDSLMLQGPKANPFRNASVWPFAGYVPLEMLMTGGIPVSISLPSDGLRLAGTSNFSNYDGFDLSNIKVTVTVNGVPVPTKDLNIYMWGSRSIVSFDALHGFLHDYTKSNPQGRFSYRYMEEDVTFEVKVEGLRYVIPALGSPHLAGKTFDPSLFQPNTVSWTFKVFDPYRIKAVAYRTKSPVSNLSTRAAIGQGDRVLIAGLTVTGEEPLQVCLRAQGPGLRKYGIAAAAQNPQIDVYQVLEGGRSRSLGGNDDWKQAANWRLIQSYGLQPSEDGESACVATLMPGLYTAIVRDAGAGGVGIVEAFAIDHRSASRLTNVSTRAWVGTGEEAMIAGFSLQESSTVVVRAQGPSLAAYGITDAVQDPVLRLVRQADGVTLDTNDDWNVPANARLNADLIQYRPGHAKEAARVLTLPAGNYTVLVESQGAPGVGIIEVFRLD